MKKIAIVLLAALMLLAISCEEQPQHEHKFLEEWKNNETQHWHECECKEKSEVANHEFETITVESTCSKKGSETVKCKVCGYVKSTKELELKAHTPAEEHVIVAPSCSEFGSDSVVCSVCGETISVVFSAKLDHTPLETPEEVKGPSCSEEGLSVVKCTVCDEVVSSTPIPCKPHTWGAWEPGSKANLKKHVCTTCGTSEISGTTSLTPEVLETAMAYDNLIGNVSRKDMYAVASIDEEARILSSDNLLYDVRYFEQDQITGQGSFEVKKADEEKYHEYSILVDYATSEITKVSIDGVEQGEDYIADKDPCVAAAKAYVVSNMSTSVCLYFRCKNVQVTDDEKNGYNISFESEYDPSKYFETRYMKITDNTGKVILEYSLKLVGPHGMPDPISELKGGDISEAEAVGMFTVDGESYDIDSVNFAISSLF